VQTTRPRDLGVLVLVVGLLLSLFVITILLGSPVTR
jgi:tetrahydromethanopterin S-methyltransferase subunit G